MVTVRDVRELLDSQQDDATLVLVEGATKVVSGDDLRSGRYPKGLLVASRVDLGSIAAERDTDDLPEAELEAVAARLTTAVEQLGG